MMLKFIPAKTAKFFLLIGLTLTTGLIVLANQPAYSCSCAPPFPPEQALMEASVVFAGEVTGIETSEGRLNVTFAIDEIWKGDLENTVVVQTPISMAACGYMFDVGQSYLVYGQERGGSLRTNQCSRTRLLSQANDDLLELHKIRPCL